MTLVLFGPDGPNFVRCLLGNPELRARPNDLRLLLAVAALANDSGRVSKDAAARLAGVRADRAEEAFARLGRAQLVAVETTAGTVGLSALAGWSAPAPEWAPSVPDGTQLELPTAPGLPEALSLGIAAMRRAADAPHADLGRSPPSQTDSAAVADGFCHGGKNRPPSPPPPSPPRAPLTRAGANVETFIRSNVATNKRSTLRQLRGDALRDAVRDFVGGADWRQYWLKPYCARWWEADEPEAALLADALFECADSIALGERAPKRSHGAMLWNEFTRRRKANQRKEMKNEQEPATRCYD
jgi:hypothetical protein